MNILVVAPMPPQRQPTNAVPLVTHALLTALAPHHHLTLVTASESGAKDNLLQEWQARGVTVHCVPRVPTQKFARWRQRGQRAAMWLRGTPWRTVWFWEPKLEAALRRVLAQEKFDVIAAQDNAVGMYDFDMHIPKILTEMEVRVPEPSAQNGAGHARGVARYFEQADARRWQKYQREVWRRFNRLQVLTPRDADALVALAPELRGRTRVNPFGIDLPAPVAPELEQEGRVLFVGGFTHPPNVDAAHWLAREIMPRVAARCPHAKLALVGSFPPASVRALAQANIEVQADVPEVEPFFAQTCVVAAPMRRGGGQRMKVLQGMAHAKPVVTTPLGAEGLTIEGAQPPLMLAHDTEGFADALVFLLSERAARRALGAQARRFVTCYFSPTAYARRLEKIYGELVE